MGARPSDLAILSTAASQLFESTRDMSTDAVISIMTALMQVSTKMVPEAAKQPGQPKYGLQPSLCDFACPTPLTASASAAVCGVQNAVHACVCSIGHVGIIMRTSR